MLHHVADPDSPLAEALEDDAYYVVDRHNIVCKNVHGVFLYYNDGARQGTNIVNVFCSLHPDFTYRSITELPFDKVIKPLRERIKIMTSEGSSP